MLSFWRNFRHWLHWKLSFWQLSVQPMTKILPKWLHLRFNVHVESSYFWYSWEIFQVPPVLWATQVPLGPWETRDQQDLLESPEPLVRQDLWDLREEPEVQVLRVSPEPQVCMPWWRHDVDILAFMWRIQRSPVDSPHKGPVMWGFTETLMSFWRNFRHWLAFHQE